LQTCKPNSVSKQKTKYTFSRVMAGSTGIYLASAVTVEFVMSSFACKYQLWDV
jgi:hypothetical protein